MSSNDYTECPGCGHVPKGFTVAYMHVLKCKKCGKRFCHHCPGSENGKECPSCGSTNIEKYGKVYAK